MTKSEGPSYAKSALDRQTKFEAKNSRIQDNIKEVDDSIIKKILICDISNKPYKIISQELKIYKLLNIPIPRKCPEIRHKEKIAIRNPRKLFNRKCDKCMREIRTTYSPDRKETIYCEECYLKEVY